MSTARPLRHPLLRNGWLLLVVAAALALSGCARFGEFARERADRAAYRIIDDVQLRTLTRTFPVDIDPPHDALTSSVLHQAGRVDWSLEEVTTPSVKLSLADTLAIAFVRSRSYRSEKESLFRQALSLTESRRDYSDLWSGSVSGDYTRTETGHQTPGPPTVEKVGSYRFGLGVEKLFLTGARVSIDFAHDYVRQFTDDPMPSADNDLSLGIVQPLLRNVGPLVTMEPLRQAERDMIYRVRSFARYQQNFVIDTASAYYGLLRSLDGLANARADLESAQTDADRAVAFAEAGNISQLEADRSRQRLLEAENRWYTAQTDYLGQLDRFKIRLGLPVTVDVGPDPAELEALVERGAFLPDMDIDHAVEFALADRLDLKTGADRVDDARRQVKIDLQNFLPNLDASYNYSTNQGAEKDRIKLDFRDNTQNWGLDLGLPLDWTPRRNRYRRSLISLDQTEREYEEARDEVILEVLDAWRTLVQTLKTYEIQVESVNLAERRVESTRLRFEGGEATTRDINDALDALLSARNARTSALVSHTIARLRFWNSIERLQIDPNGMWYDETMADGELEPAAASQREE